MFIRKVVMRVKKFILYLFFVLFVSDITAYAFFAYQFEIKSVFRTVWGVSLYIVSFLAIICVEKIHRNIQKAIAKKVYYRIFSISLFFSIIILFFLSFLVAYYHNDSSLHNLLSIMFILLCCFILVAPNILLKYYTPISKTEARKKVSEIENQSVKYGEAIFDYLVTRSISFKDKANIVWGNVLVVAFYVIFIFTLFFINSQHNNVSNISICIATIFLTVLLILNWLKCYICNYKKRILLAECGLLTLSIVVYIGFQWIILPMTFNLLLTIATVAMLGYTINNNVLLAKKLMDMFSENEE